MVMLGREVHQPVDLVIGVPDMDPAPPDHDDYVADLHARMKSIFEMVRATLKKSAERQKRDYDTRIAINNYSCGDLVYMLDTTKTIGLSPKLKSDVWKGPCIITRKISDLLFEIKLGQKKRLKVLHHDRLKPYASQEVPDWAKQLQLKVQNLATPAEEIVQLPEPAASSTSGINMKKQNQAPPLPTVELPSPHNSTALRRSSRKRAVPNKLDL